MWRLVNIGFLLALMVLSASAQSGTEEQILAQINQNRSIPLVRDPNLDALAAELLNTFEADCTYFGGGDAAKARAIGWQGDFEVVRTCGINRTVADANAVFTQQRSSITNQALISETRWNVVGLATGEFPTSTTPQFRYVMVLGESVSKVTPAPSIDLSTEFSAESLGLVFPQPAAWTATTAAESVTLLANPADQAAATDGDPSTRAAQPFLSLTRLNRTQLALSPDAGLAEATKFVSNVLSFTPSQTLTHQVMAYPTATLIGADANQSAGIVSFWLQSDALMIMALTTPTLEEAQGWLPVWEQILSQVRPSLSLKLSENTRSQFMNVQVHYPANWVIFDANDRFGLFEQSSDRDLYVAGQFAYFSGVVITALFQPTQQLIDSGILPPNPTLDQLLELNTRFVGLSNIRKESGQVFGQAAYFVEATDSSGFQIYGVMGFVDGNVYFVQAASPNSLEKFKPTFRWMAHQFRRVQ